MNKFFRGILAVIATITAMFGIVTLFLAVSEALNLDFDNLGMIWKTIGMGIYCSILIYTYKFVYRITGRQKKQDETV